MNFDLKHLFFCMTVAAIVCVTLSYIYKVNKRLGDSYSEIVKPFKQVDASSDPQWTVFGKPIIETFYADVIAVTNGDTIKILNEDNEEIQIRLESIDTPEMDQAFGTKSKQKLSDLVFGNYVKLLKTGEDRDRRTLAFVIFDRQNLSEVMIQDGYAWHDKQSSNDETLARLETQARKSERGLWADPEPIPPWEFRPRKSE